jgi:hypothetical protein
MTVYEELENFLLAYTYTTAFEIALTTTLEELKIIESRNRRFFRELFKALKPSDAAGKI